MLSTFLALLLAVAPGDARPVSAQTHRASADRSVATPEGIRFALPGGLAYSIEEADGRRFHVGKRADDTAAVIVTAFASDSELPCGGDDRAEARVEAFRTARGLRACSVSAEEEREALALVFVKAGETVVAITAVGADDELAALARAVADSVVVGPPERGAKLARVDVPKLDERLVGCFERDVSGYGLVITRRRCFADDATYTWRYSYISRTGVESAVTSTVTGLFTAGGREHHGTWVAWDGSLRLDDDDGDAQEFSFQLEGEDLLLDGELWRRM